jgi:hypothetical protein
MPTREAAVSLAVDRARAVQNEFVAIHVDPDNRLVAIELERHWNKRLKRERRLQDELDALSAAPSRGITQASERRCSNSAPTSRAPGMRKERP